MFRLVAFLVVVIIIAAVLTFDPGSRDRVGLRGLAAPTVSINDLLRNAAGYNGEVVRTSGVVGGSIGILGAGAFHLQDAADGSEIAVIASGGLPPMGTTLTVTGTFKQTIVIGNIQYAVIVQDL
jgi:hypothetical protein